MKRGVSYGGGQSSLGYLFGSDSKNKNEAPPASPTTYLPPYGIDTGDGKTPPSHQDKSSKESNSYPRVQGQMAGNFITGRPSTKVKSPPGGDSSLGYLFEDKP